MGVAASAATGAAGGTAGGAEAGERRGCTPPGTRAPALRLALSAGGATLPLERPSWTVYRAVLALNARLPAHDVHRDTTYT